MKKSKEELAGDIALSLGMLSQLYTTRMNKLLSEHGFTLSQFSVLSHCIRQSEENWTISRLAKVMELNQPGITKIVQKLLSRGLLSAEKDESDSRRKYLQVTPEGLAELQSIYKSLAPDVTAWFTEWDSKMMENFNQHLARLSTWLDKNRDVVGE
ncbi:MAG: MarR family transcriptional regulator [Anaerolineae bacterium]|nr:MarR family transcriptional regulator [Anaerolineae bacterium]